MESIRVDCNGIEWNGMESTRVEWNGFPQKKKKKILYMYSHKQLPVVCQELFDLQPQTEDI